MGYSGQGYPVRLGLLGPAEGDLDGLAQAAEFLLNTIQVARAIYLGNDGALDTVVRAWASSVIGGDPSQDATWQRAIELCKNGGPTEISTFVEKERARLRLKSLELVPRHSRVIELIANRFAILVYDKALLDEDDIAAANFLIYGKSQQALIKRIGSRWFITPGKIGSADGGIAVLEDTSDALLVTIHDANRRIARREQLELPGATRLRVMGDP